MPEPSDFTLGTLANGRVIQKADNAIKRAMLDILDPNKKRDTTRVVTIKVSLKPELNSAGRSAQVAVDIIFKPAPEIPTDTTLLLARNSDGTSEVKESYQYTIEDLKLAEEAESEEEDADASSSNNTKSLREVGNDS